MTRSTKAERAAAQEANEDTCSMFGHLPEPEAKPVSFGEMHSAVSMRCSRCGEVVVRKEWRDHI